MSELRNLKNQLAEMIALIESVEKETTSRQTSNKTSLQKVQKSFALAHTALSKYLESLSPSAPTKQTLKEALADNRVNMILNHITGDKKRKAFLTEAYFETLWNKLPKKDNNLLTLPLSSNKYKHAVILHYWWGTRKDAHKGVDELFQRIQNDYLASPEAKKEFEAGKFVQQLMGIKDVDETAERLAERYPSDAALKEFAKLVSLKIPSQLKGKSAPKLTAHQRFARDIHSRGSVARLELD